MSDPYGISDYLEDPDVRAQAEALAPAVQQYPEIVQTMSNMTGVDPGQAAGSDFNVLTGRTKRDDLWDWLQKRQQANQQDFDAKAAVLDKQAGSAQMDDAFRQIRLGLQSVANSRFPEDARYYREQAERNPNAEAIGGKRAQLYKWLQDKNKSEIDLFDAANRGLSAESSDAYKQALMAKMGQSKDPAAIDPGGFKQQGLDIRKEELALKKSESARKSAMAGLAREEKGKKAEQDRQAAVESQRIPFIDGDFVGDGKIDKAIISKIFDKVAGAKTIISSLEESKKMVKEIIDNPAKFNRAGADALGTLIAPKINVTQGQGAMSHDEYARMGNVIGKVDRPEFWVDMARSLVSDNPDEKSRALERINAAQWYFKNDALQTADTARMRFVPRSAKDVQPESGVVTLKFKDGKTKKTTRAAAEAWLSDHKGMGEIVNGKQ